MHLSTANSVKIGGCTKVLQIARNVVFSGAAWQSLHAWYFAHRHSGRRPFCAHASCAKSTE
eukprot:4244894-Karenia_brevis.AAC.1